MATYKDVQIHPVPSNPTEKPKITVNVTTSNISRSGNNVSVKVSVSMNYLGGSSYFGYYIRLYAQLNNSSRVELFYKPNLPNRWDSGEYSGETTLTTSTTSSNATLKLFFQSNDDCLNNKTEQVWSKSIDVPAPPAPIVKATSTTCTATQIGWSATSDMDVVEWSYKFQDKWYTYSGAARSSSKTLGVSGGQYSIQVSAKRSSGQKGYSNVLKYDCRRPSINSARLTITNASKGSLSFSCDYDCRVYFNGDYLTYAAANTTIIKDVSLKANSISSNTLLAKRASNSSLQSSVILSADTRVPTITLNCDVDGNTVYVKATSEYDLKNWTLKFTPASGFTAPVITKTFNNPNMSLEYITSESDGLITGVTYKVQVTAIREINNLSGSSNIVTVTPQGGTYIKTADGYKYGNFYIYDKNEWKKVETVYIRTPTEWTECR